MSPPQALIQGMPEHFRRKDFAGMVCESSAGFFVCVSALVHVLTGFAHRDTSWHRLQAILNTDTARVRLFTGNRPLFWAEKITSEMRYLRFCCTWAAANPVNTDGVQLSGPQKRSICECV